MSTILWALVIVFSTGRYDGEFAAAVPELYFTEQSDCIAAAAQIEQKWDGSNSAQSVTAHTLCVQVTETWYPDDERQK